MKQSIIDSYKKNVGYTPSDWSEQEALNNLIELKRIEREQFITIEAVERELTRFCSIYSDEIACSFMKPEIIQTGNEVIGEFFFIRLSANGYLDSTELVWLQNESDIGDWFLTYVDTY